MNFQSGTEIKYRKTLLQTIAKDSRKGWCQGSFVSFSEEKETKDCAAFFSSVLFALSSPLFSSVLLVCLPPSPSAIPPPPRWVYYCVFPDGLIVVFWCFVRPFELFPHCFRCFAASLAEVPPLLTYVHRDDNCCLCPMTCFVVRGKEPYENGGQHCCHFGR